MRRIPLLLLAGLSLAFAPLPRRKPDRAGADLKAMQGAWVLFTQTVNGGALELGGGEITLVIHGDRMKDAYDGRPTREWVFTLDAKTDPTRIDRQEVASSALRTQRGIYRLTADTLTLCSGRGDRPADFDGSGDGVIFEVFRRKRP